MADRMRKTLREADVSVQDMAEYLEVSRNTVGSWINGKTRPNAASLKLWALRVGIPYEWIRYGESPQAGGPEGSQSGLPRLDLNQRPSDYLSPQVRCDVAPLPRRSGTGRSRHADLIRRREFGAGAAA